MKNASSATAEDGTQRVTANAKIGNMIEIHISIQKAIIDTDRERFSDTAAILDTYESLRKADEDEKEAHKAETLLEVAAVAACQEEVNGSKESLATAIKQKSEVQAANARLKREVKAQQDLTAAHVLQNKPKPTPDQLAEAAKSAESFVEMKQCGHTAPMVGITRTHEQKVPHFELVEQVNAGDDTLDESATDEDY